MAAGSYDAAGNLVSITGSALTYDAENRLTSATQSGIGTMDYYYDGAGRRVQEISTYNTEKVFVYDAFGRLSAEYSTGMPAPPCTTCYIAADHLGSTRLVTDQNGNTVGRHDYVPFGEEIAANTGGRDGTFGTQDFVNQKFTGQEQDVETGLDFFQARYFSGVLGRFNSPDPGNAGANLFNPQSWNGYTYVYNNPLTLIDPSGLTTCDENGNNCHDTITVPGGPPDPILTDPCFFFNCGSGGSGYYDKPLKIIPPRPLPPKVPIILAKNGTCLVPRLATAAKGLVNLGVGATKITLAAKSVASVPISGPLGVAGAIYGLIGASGNIAAGFLQIAGAATGNIQRANEAANIATTTTTIGGFIVYLATNGNLNAASTAAGVESLGTAGVNGGLTGHLIDQAANSTQKLLLSTELGQNAADAVGVDTTGTCIP